MKHKTIALIILTTFGFLYSQAQIVTEGNHKKAIICKIRAFAFPCDQTFIGDTDYSKVIQ